MRGARSRPYVMDGTLNLALGPDLAGHLCHGVLFLM